MDRIDPAEIIKQRLAAGMGLDKYAVILNTVRAVDVSADADFQRVFNGFYRIRRNTEWRAAYYRLFESVKRSGPMEFDYILDELFLLTGNAEASFSGKMLATLNPQMLIWDSHVVRNLGLSVPAPDDPGRLRKIKALYARIIEWYASFLTTDNAKECLAEFDKILPDYIWLADVKKIDFYLWSIR